MYSGIPLPCEPGRCFSPANGYRILGVSSSGSSGLNRLSCHDALLELVDLHKRSKKWTVRKVMVGADCCVFCYL